MLKKIFVVIALLLLVNSLQASEMLVKVESVEIGDYCWLHTIDLDDAKKEDSFVMNVQPSQSKICDAEDSASATSIWKGKVLKISVKPFSICEHIPPCEAHDKLLPVKSIVKYQILSH